MISTNSWRKKMTTIRHTITAIKPDGTLVKIVGRTPQAITVIQSAMVVNKYTDIKVTKDPSPEVLFIRGLMQTHNIPAKSAIDMYKKMAVIMSMQGIEIARKGDVNGVV